MKNLLYLLLCTCILCYSCSDNDKDDYITYPVTIELVYPENSGVSAAEGVSVRMLNTINGTSFDTVTNAAGVAYFDLPAGVYEASATDRRTNNFYRIVLNSLKSGITISSSWTGSEVIKLDLIESVTSQILIKEIYNGGCQKDDGSGAFRKDQYVILYNNSDVPASLENVCLGMVVPANAHATNNDYDSTGNLKYATKNWIPAGDGFWYFSNAPVLQPGQQIVIALTNALDNTKTYSNSINFANSEYYCTYDIDAFSLASYYPSPSESIPVSHYLKAYKNPGVLSTAWVLSVTSPAFYIFKTNGTTPAAFGQNPDNLDAHGTSKTAIRKKVPVEWIMDGIEIFKYGENKSKKRLTPDIDAGYTNLIGDKGYALYRNVDKNATEAIRGNKDKLVYSYNLGTTGIEGGSTDPSGIDAEASIKNGAIIIYMDTNNSSNDFHLRKQASLRD